MPRDIEHDRLVVISAEPFPLSAGQRYINPWENEPIPQSRKPRCPGCGKHCDKLTCDQCHAKKARAA